MKRSILMAVAVALISTYGVFPAEAIENGTDSPNNPFVVPLYSEINATQAQRCSGALLAPRIVATAGHCVLDDTGLVSKDIRIGSAGAQYADMQNWIKVDSVQITPTFQSGSYVKADDIVFLVLHSSLVVATPVKIASESEMLALKSSSAKLRLVGYGATDNSGTNSSIPRFLDAQFSQATAGSTQPNSSFAQTTYGDLCAGDSGGPVLYITATSVVVVGVLTGSYGSGLCDEKNSNGNYYALFTLLNRYSNLAFSAALNVMNSDETSLGDALTSSAQLGKDLGASKVNIDSLTNLVEVKNGIIDDKSKLVATLQNQISDLLAQISRMKTQIPTTITCISGRVTKKITSVKAKCPAGFKLKM